ncbi:Sugar or nucleoside kinase, ribokinase family [Anaerovirgula multivorans]|uniref:Sugar or nucleoside kinase, ribokinase family n=1 Tax=Anaerovirgula multivorans TaxID=312168 RepID=A0A239AQW6_9FIRM|nr:PfkB family carbohydrate kinase [Anaerovirgula multivorans]SNR97702.1 Sugar or nucleoside kinase, ribokinase family [Anaerovirgula multivorans]
MKNYDTFIIGHICLDKIVAFDTGEISEAVGGAVTFSSYSAVAGGHKTGVLTKTSKEDMNLLDYFILPKEDIYFLESEKTTSIKNEFLSADNERRICTALSVADPFTMKDIPNVNSKIYHLAGLIAGDFDNDMMKQLSTKGKVAVDMQGFLRVVEDGKMVFKDWKEKMEYLPYIHFLKTDAAEAEVLTGYDDREKAARVLFEWGAKEVMITHNTEVITYGEEGLCTFPLKPRNISGRTGRGDTCFSAYITERMNKGMEESLLYAAALVSLKMETPGPFKGTRSDVENYIDRFYHCNTELAID